MKPMRYLSLFRPMSGEEGSMPSPEHMAAMGKLIDEMTRSGHLISTEPVLPRQAGCQITRSGGRFTVSGLDGRMGGFAFLQADSKEELIEITKKFLDVAGDGVCEIRQIMEFAPVSA
jgi:hypothetical protein